MTDVAETVEVIPAPDIRRYQSADIQRQAIWLFPRMQRAFPHMSREQHYTWLLNMLNGSEFYPLYHEHGFALACIVSKPMQPNTHIEEVFVFLEDPKNPDHQFVGAHFYNHFYKWAERIGLRTIFIENQTDVERKNILAFTGSRVFELKQAYMRV